MNNMEANGTNERLTMTRTDIIKAQAISAPEFDSNGWYGSYHPNRPDTDCNSLYWGLNTEDRLTAISFRQAMTEAPKCARYFNQGSCDLPRNSHVCHDGEGIHV